MPQKKKTVKRKQSVKKPKTKKAKRLTAPLTVPVLDHAGTAVGEVQLPATLFGAAVNERLLQQALTAAAASKRQGTASTKTRKEVRGGGRKPWRQKGTGRARAGSIRSPIWRGGGTVFGPHPRDYSVVLPQRFKRRALVHALSLRMKEGAVTVVQDVTLPEPKTKTLVQCITAWKLADKRSVCVVPKVDTNLARASRNIDKRFHVESAQQLSAYNVLRRGQLVLAQDAIQDLEKRLAVEVTA